MRRLGATFVAAVAALTALAAPAVAYDWLQFNGDAAHSGNNTFEQALDRNNVAALTFQVPSLR